MITFSVECPIACENEHPHLTYKAEVPKLSNDLLRDVDKKSTTLTNVRGFGDVHVYNVDISLNCEARII
jgi:hypothetical protein